MLLSGQFTGGLGTSILDNLPSKLYSAHGKLLQIEVLTTMRKVRSFET
jgi:hypothetical protein